MFPTKFSRLTQVWVHFFWCTCLLTPAFGKVPVCARATVVIGDVVTKKEGPLRPGDTLLKGTIVVTPEDGAAKFLLNDDSIVDLGPSTTFKFSECESPTGKVSISLDLNVGTARANVNKETSPQREKFQIKTPTSVLAVRGTEFLVEVKPLGSGVFSQKVAVFEGKVAMNVNGAPPSVPEVQIGAGQKVHFENTDAPTNPPPASDAKNKEGSGAKPTETAWKGGNLKSSSITENDKAQFDTAFKVADPVFVNSLALTDKTNTPPPGSKGDTKPTAGFGSETTSTIFETVTGSRTPTEKKEKSNDTSARTGAPGNPNTAKNETKVGGKGPEEEKERKPASSSTPPPTKEDDATTPGTNSANTPPEFLSPPKATDSALAPGGTQPIGSPNGTTFTPGSVPGTSGINTPAGTGTSTGATNVPVNNINVRVVFTTGT